jgi:hypothetical protein
MVLNLMIAVKSGLIVIIIIFFRSPFVVVITAMISSTEHAEIKQNASLIVEIL